MRRAVPLPSGIQNQPARNISSSVFNLNHHNGYPQPGYQQPNPWGMNNMSQVSDFERCGLATTDIDGFLIQAQSMAHLNMMGNQWNMNHQGWPGQNQFNGSNMSLNMMPAPGYMPSDQQMWNTWMQQQQFGFPMMPGGEC